MPWKDGHVLVDVTCPICSKTRQVSRRMTLTKRFTGKCLKCKNKRIISLPVARPKTPAKYTIRTCLKCEQTFMSRGVGNRICIPCQISNENLVCGTLWDDTEEISIGRRS